MFVRYPLRIRSTESNERLWERKMPGGRHSGPLTRPAPDADQSLTVAQNGNLYFVTILHLEWCSICCRHGDYFACRNPGKTPKSDFFRICTISTNGRERRRFRASELLSQRSRAGPNTMDIGARRNRFTHRKAVSWLFGECIRRIATFFSNARTLQSILRSALPSITAGDWP